jgi:hypothetical protein
MRRVSMLTAGAWMVATSVATLVSWTGVGVVSRAVTTAPEPVLPAARIADAVSAGSSGTGSQGTSPASGAGIATSSTRRTPPSPPSSQVPSGQLDQTSPTTVPRSSAAAPDSPAAGAVTYSTVGGQATVACQGDAISLESASPAVGYQLSVQSSGPDRVALTFTGNPDQNLVITCQDGRPNRVGQPGNPGGPGPGSGPDRGDSGNGGSEPGTSDGSGSGASGGGQPGGSPSGPNKGSRPTQG